MIVEMASVGLPKTHLIYCVLKFATIILGRHFHSSVCVFFTNLPSKSQHFHTIKLTPFFFTLTPCLSLLITSLLFTEPELCFFGALSLIVYIPSTRPSVIVYHFLTSANIIMSSSIHAVREGKIWSSKQLSSKYFMQQIPHDFFFPSFFDGHLDRFCLGHCEECCYQPRGASVFRYLT